MTARDLAETWRIHGPRGLEVLDRRELLSCIPLLAEHVGTAGPLVLVDGLAQTLDMALDRRRVRPARRTAAWFELALLVPLPLPQVLIDLIRRLGAGPRAPKWFPVFAERGATGVAQELVRDLYKDSSLAFANALDVPDDVWRGPWRTTLVAVAPRPRQPEEVQRLLDLADGFEPERTTSPDAPLVAAIQAAVAWSKPVDPATRRPVATRIVRRIGNPFTGGDRWRALEPERTQLKAWLAGDLLDLFFTLLPSYWHQRQHDARQKFWAQYSCRLERAWLFVADKRALAQRLGAERLAELQGIVNVREITDLGSDGACLWLQLTDGASTATIIEWNGMGAIRLSQGHHEPPINVMSASSLRWSLHSYDKIIHNVSWTKRTERALYTLGIRPC